MRDTCRIDLKTTAPFRIGPLCVEPALWQVSTDSTVAETLEPRVMLVLVALAQAEGGILSRDQLIEQGCNSRIVGDDSNNHVISRQRKLASAHGDGALFSIETISKVGYRLVACATEAPNPALPGRAASHFAANSTRSLRARPMVLATAAAAIIALASGISLWPARAASDGTLELAVTTAAGPGTAPGAAQALRDEMGSVYGPEHWRIVGPSPAVGRLSARIANMGGEQVVFGELQPPGGGPAIWMPLMPLRDAGSIKGVASFALAHTGRPAQAIALEARMFASQGANTLRARYSPGLAAARQTPEFAGFVTRIGLADYWHKSGNNRHMIG